MLIRLSIQVYAQYRKRAGLEGPQPREVLLHDVSKVPGDRGWHAANTCTHLANMAEGGILTGMRFEPEARAPATH